MEITNFKLEETKGDRLLDRIYVASVDVKTGFLFWKKEERRQIQRSYGSCWFFVDNGEFVSGFQIDALERSWTARTGQEL